MSANTLQAIELELKESACAHPLTATVMLTLKQRIHGFTSQTFSIGQLSEWMSDEKYRVQVGVLRCLLKRLAEEGFVRREGAREHVWRLTRRGERLCQAAWRALPHAPGPDPTYMKTRLWNLLRIRRRLTAEEAADTLVDADAANWSASRQYIRSILSTWARLSPDVVTRGAKTEKTRVRFVLLKDVGRWPPISQSDELHPRIFAERAPFTAKRYLRKEFGHRAAAPKQVEAT